MAHPRAKGRLMENDPRNRESRAIPRLYSLTAHPRTPGPPTQCIAQRSLTDIQTINLSKKRRFSRAVGTVEHGLVPEVSNSTAIFRFGWVGSMAIKNGALRCTHQKAEHLHQSGLPAPLGQALCSFTCKLSCDVHQRVFIVVGFGDTLRSYGIEHVSRFR